MFNPEFLATDNSEGQAGNSLIQYLQDQSPDTLQRVAKSAMMTGYFLRQMEQRKELEETLFADEQMAVEDDELNL